jgi:ATP-binding cassette subfamily C protein LapB
MLLLDEPTAAMDNGLEAGVIQRLAPALEGKTLIVATHRAPILKLVDRLIVVDQGKVDRRWSQRRDHEKAERCLIFRS